MKVISNTFVANAKIISYLKEQKFQLYVVPDLETPLKVVLRGLPKSIDPDKIINELNDKSFDVSNTTEMHNRKRRENAPSFPSKFDT